MCYFIFCIDHVSITNEAATGVAPIIVDKEGLWLCQLSFSLIRMVILSIS
jgi:hypothetical protein